MAPVGVITVAGLLALCAAVSNGTAKLLAPPTGDPGGLALLARVHHAYVNVSAVTIWGDSGALSFRFTVVLRSGFALAEQYVGTEPTGRTMLVARRGSSTFAREPGTSCWRRLAASDPQALEDIGLRFPDLPRMKLERPRRTASGWLLPVVSDGAPFLLAIDGTSMLIRSITIGAGGKRVLERVGTLRSVPRLLLPKPRC
jgi:hypothetical protein